jgi:hypothetical protein
MSTQQQIARGGGIYQAKNHLNLNRCLFLGNSAGITAPATNTASPQVAGGGLYSAGASATLNQTLFLGNSLEVIGGNEFSSRSASGGAVVCSAGTLVMDTCRLVNNSAEFKAEVIDPSSGEIMELPSGEGGGLAVSGGAAFIVGGETFADNTASNFPGIFVQGTGRAHLVCGIGQYGAVVTVDSNTNSFANVATGVLPRVSMTKYALPIPVPTASRLSHLLDQDKLPIRQVSAAPVPLADTVPSRTKLPARSALVERLLAMPLMSTRPQPFRGSVTSHQHRPPILKR